MFNFLQRILILIFKVKRRVRAGEPHWYNLSDPKRDNKMIQKMTKIMKPKRWSKSTRDWSPVRLVRLNPEKGDVAAKTQHLKKAARLWVS
jgi:hypothetical protein